MISSVSKGNATEPFFLGMDSLRKLVEGNYNGKGKCCEKPMRFTAFSTGFCHLICALHAAKASLLSRRSRIVIGAIGCVHFLKVVIKGATAQGFILAAIRSLRIFIWRDGIIRSFIPIEHPLADISGHLQ